LLLLLLVAVTQVFSGSPGGCKCDTGGHNCFCTYTDKRTKSGDCEGNYIPGGGKVVLDPIDAPTAKIAETGTATVAKYVGFTANLADQTVNVVDIAADFSKTAKALAGGMGIFGSVIGGLGDHFTPTPNDIIDAVNQAIAELTQSVNNQFINMQDYVDEQIRELKSEMMNDAFNYFAAFAAECLRRADVSEDAMVQCVETSATQLSAAKVGFLDFKDYIGDKKWEATTDQAKQMELDFITVMNYATLQLNNLMITSSVYGSIANLTTDADKLKQLRGMACMYLDEITTDAKLFQDYVTMMYDQIHAQHTNQYTYLSEEGDRGCTYNNDKWNMGGTCDYNLSDMQAKSMVCSFYSMARYDGQCPSSCDYKIPKTVLSPYPISSQGAIHYDTKNQAIHVLQNVFQPNILKSVENYWIPQTTDRFKAWQEIRDSVAQVKGFNQCGSVQSFTQQSKSLFDHSVAKKQPKWLRTKKEEL